jgi:tetratricopeptide (TPR) repeat protein
MPILSSLASGWWAYWGLVFRGFGNWLAWKEGYARAVDCFTRGLAATPRRANLYYWRGTLCWRELGELGQAEADLTRAIELNPNLARAYLNRAFVRWYALPPNREGAVEDFQAYLARGDDPYWRGQAQEHLQGLSGT